MNVSDFVYIVLCFVNDRFIYKTIDITDSPDSRLIDHFEETSDFIRDCLDSGGRCLVHCFAGMSRSVTVVSAYLMREHRMGAIGALKLVSRKRTQARPNAGFILQLVKYQTVLGIKSKDTDDAPPEFDDVDDEVEQEEHEHGLGAAADEDDNGDGTITPAVPLSLHTADDSSAMKTAPPFRLSVNSPKTKSPPLSGKSSSSMHSHSVSTDSCDSLLSVRGLHEPSESMGVFLKTLLQKKAEKVGFDSPSVSEIDMSSKRRPSLLTALERFRAIKTQSQKNVLAAVGSAPPLPDGDELVAEEEDDDDDDLELATSASSTEIDEACTGGEIVSTET